MEVIWARLALTDIDRIGQYIAQDNVLQAQRLVRDIKQATSRLKTFPMLGAVLSENIAFRSLVVRRYRVVYRISSRIEIVRVLGPGRRTKV